MLITTSIIFSIIVLSVVTYIVIQDGNNDNNPNTIDDNVKEITTDIKERIEEIKEVDLEKIKH